MKVDYYITCVIYIYRFKYIIKEPTFFTSLDDQSLIDVILVLGAKTLNESLDFETGLSEFHKIAHAQRQLLQG